MQKYKSGLQHIINFLFNKRGKRVRRYIQRKKTLVLKGCSNLEYIEYKLYLNFLN